MKKNSDSKWGAFNVSRGNMWGTYCPETGEYYLARVASYGPSLEEVVEVLASAREMPDGEWQEQSYSGYDYEVVRELLQLGHLTSQTLASFIEAGGEVWWEQPQ